MDNLYQVTRDDQVGDDDQLMTADMKPTGFADKWPAYRLAFRDEDFIACEEMRGLRLQMELLKPELALNQHGIESTFVIFGGSRIPEPGTEPDAPTEAVKARLKANAHYYNEARQLALWASEQTIKTDNREFVVVSGGGPGVMEAANRGASDVGAPSIGLHVMLPRESDPNVYVTPELCFRFHYYSIRKMHFLMRAKALACFPGGYGTLDELFEVMTLFQQRKVAAVPILLVGRAFWEKLIDFQLMVDEGTIAPDDLKLFSIVDSAEEGWEIIRAYYGLSQQSEAPV